MYRKYKSGRFTTNKINTQKKLLEDKNKKQPIINKSNKSYKIYEDYIDYNIDYNNDYDEEY
jgi:hypothetical protein